MFAAYSLVHDMTKDIKCQLGGELGHALPILISGLLICYNKSVLCLSLVWKLPQGCKAKGCSKDSMTAY